VECATDDDYQHSDPDRQFPLTYFFIFHRFPIFVDLRGVAPLLLGILPQNATVWANAYWVLKSRKRRLFLWLICNSRP
jgi:hypothetical protein